MYAFTHKYSVKELCNGIFQYMFGKFGKSKRCNELIKLVLKCRRSYTFITESRILEKF